MADKKPPTQLVLREKQIDELDKLAKENPYIVQSVHSLTQEEKEMLSSTKIFTEEEMETFSELLLEIVRRAARIEKVLKSPDILPTPKKRTTTEENNTQTDKITPIHPKHGETQKHLTTDDFIVPSKVAKKPKKTHTPPIETHNKFDILSEEEKMEEDVAEQNKPSTSKQNTVNENKQNDEQTQSHPENKSKTKKYKISPIIVTEKEKHRVVRQLVKDNNINIAESKLVKAGIHLEPQTERDYETLCNTLDNEIIEFYTFTPRNEKTLKIVIRGIPTLYSNEEIEADLLDRGYPIQKIKRMNGKFGVPAPLHMVELSKDHRSIFDLLYVVDLKVKVESLRKRTTVIQCHKCQLFGHQQRNCHVGYKCLKCGDGHSTHLCDKPKNKPPKCANCGGEHPSNWTNCLKNPNNPNIDTQKPKYIPAPIPTSNAWSQPRQRNNTDAVQPSTTKIIAEDNNEQLALTLGKMLLTLLATNATQEQKLDFLNHTEKIIEIYNAKN